MAETKEFRSRSRSGLGVLNSQTTVALSLLGWWLLVSRTGNTYATDVAGDVSNNTSYPVVVINVTETPKDECPGSKSCEDDCGGAVAGAVVASLIAGLITGALAMYFAQRYLKKRKMSIPPKDYTNTESSALDVNMNNGERTVRDCDEISSADDVPQIKGHKKLERLSKQGPKPVIGPKPVLGPKGKPNIRSSVETPLIYIGPRNDKIDSSNDSAPSPAFPRDTDMISIPVLQQSNDLSVGDEGGGSDADAGSDADSEQGNVYQDVDYTNIGLDAALSQPYDALEAIPEEVEYANTQEYEQLGLVS